MKGVLALALLLALMACAPTGLVGAGPVTVHDEAAAVGAADAAYIAASQTARSLSQQGLLSDERRRAFDDRAYAALIAVRALAAAVRAGTVPQADLANAVGVLDAAATDLATSRD